MKLKERIASDFKKAFMEKDQIRKSVLSMIQSEIKNKEIELGLKSKGRDLPDENVIEVLGKAQKQRQDSIENYLKGDRKELADKEKEELAIIESYLPEQMSAEELEKEIDAIISEGGFTGKQDFGKAMGIAMSKLKGKADGGKIKEIVEKKLSE